ncbi:hypothetical protein [Sulfuricella sp.]|uniref:hypothetical protein n=1 Tax=Sulfuricella sp. TaxID=2099377 RepID=UPI002CC2AAB4|nr:hypothetical protein [Sulfuricella sp.]HUX64496.1 hypothetical protein [Sulfuricella sp.]
MKNGLSTIAWRGMLAGILAMSAMASLAADTSQHKVVDGVAIYIGVLPAEMVKGHPRIHSEGVMHDGIPTGKNRYHLVVALFDDASGKRISGAGVKARVSEFGLPGQEKKLDPMVIAGTVTYGNYFTMPNPGPYRIHLEIGHARIHSVGTIEAEFEYRRP